MAGTVFLTQVVEDSPLAARKRILVLNSSHAVAQKIGTHLRRTFPGSSLIYAPTLSLARLILNRRPLDLIVSCAQLPDGKAEDLRPLLNGINEAPRLIIYKGEHPQSHLEEELPPHTASALSANPSEDIRALGADLRNDLNNPLQTISTMLYVALSERPTSEASQVALDAISQAVRGMSEVVKSLEGRMLSTLVRERGP